MAIFNVPNDFYRGLDLALETSVNVYGPLSGSDPRLNVFSQFEVSGGVMTAVYNQTNPFKNIWGAHYPSRLTNGDFTSLRVGVAISPRHVISGEGHVSVRAGDTLTWAIPGDVGQPATTFSSTCIDQQFSLDTDYGGSATHPNDGLDNAWFHLSYMDRDIPSDLICPMFFPTDIDASKQWGRDAISGWPVVVCDRYPFLRTKVANIRNEESSIFAFHPYWAGESEQRNVNPPARNDLRAATMDSLNMWSGSPAFACYHQNQFVFMGIFSEGPVQYYQQFGLQQYQGPGALNFHDGIVAAMDIISRRNNATTMYRPTYLKPSEVRPPYRPPASGPLGP
jgi:hypothetical protein